MERWFYIETKPKLPVNITIRDLCTDEFLYVSQVKSKTFLLS